MCVSVCALDGVIVLYEAQKVGRGAGHSFVCFERSIKGWRNVRDSPRFCFGKFSRGGFDICSAGIRCGVG